jgi:hypothetical protein
VTERFGTHYAEHLQNNPSAIAEKTRLKVLEILQALHEEK